MAPIDPILAPPRKRASPSSEDGDGFAESESPCKRPRTDSIPSKAESVVEDILFDAPEKVVSENDGPHQLLSRAVALALEHVGFDAASAEALEAMCSNVDSYINKLLSQVSESMLSGKRSQPIPGDFQYALVESNVHLSSLEPHLRPPIPKEKLLMQLESLPIETLSTATTNIDSLLGGDLSGQPDKLARPYVPRRFPSFPSKHTYKWTETESARETDPRKIREEAAKVARQGEEALRRLTKVAKAAKEKDVKKAASKDPTSKERHNLWEQAMEELGRGPLLNISARKVNEEDDRGLIVNADRLFYRQGPIVRRRNPLEPRPTIES